MEQALCVEEIQTYLKMSFKKCWKVLLLQTDVLYTGKTGSGHYLKMIHNAMLYGYMQTLGEGFELVGKE